MDADELKAKHCLIDPPRPEAVRWFRQRGVSANAIAEPELFAAGAVAYQDRRPRFDFADEVEDARALVPALIFLARDEFGEPVDFVAWSYKLGRVASWIGRAALLGAESIFAPRIADEGALPIHETPLEWLQAERRGVVIVDEARAGPLLREASPLLAPNVPYGLRIEAIARPTPARILVRKSEVAAAA